MGFHILLEQSILRTNFCFPVDEERLQLASSLRGTKQFHKLELEMSRTQSTALLPSWDCRAIARNDASNSSSLRGTKQFHKMKQSSNHFTSTALLPLWDYFAAARNDDHFLSEKNIRHQ